jgi:hypothetical protein
MADGLDPREAARLLDQTRRDAQRQFDLSSPLLSLLGAAVVLVALGAVWLSVRNQHPYKGPTPAALGVLYGGLIVWILVVVAFTQRALAGLSGRSTRQQRAYAAAVAIGLIGVSVFQAVLKGDGVSNAVVYGTYPLTVQLIVLGTLGAAMQANREHWLGFGECLAIVIIATGSAFAGPRGVWLSDAIGLCVVVLAYAATGAWLRRAPASA